MLYRIYRKDNGEKRYLKDKSDSIITLNSLSAVSVVCKSSSEKYDSVEMLSNNLLVLSVVNISHYL